jgi:hypothetical protein
VHFRGVRQRRIWLKPQCAESTAIRSRGIAIYIQEIASDIEEICIYIKEITADIEEKAANNQPSTFNFSSRTPAPHP